MNNKDMLLSLKSDTFSAMQEDFDAILAKTIRNMEMRGAGDAAITLKLSIAIEKSTANDANDVRDISRPSFNHEIRSVMQIKDKKAGALTGDYELVWDVDEGKYVMRRIVNEQIGLFDDDEDFIDGKCREVSSKTAEISNSATGFLVSPPQEEKAHTREQNKGRITSADAVPTPFWWLSQFVGKKMKISESLGNYTVRTLENEIVLSSAAINTSHMYCEKEKLEPHIGHHIKCVWFDCDDEPASISVECVDCNEILFEAYITGEPVPPHIEQEDSAIEGDAEKDGEENDLEDGFEIDDDYPYDLPDNETDL